MTIGEDDNLMVVVHPNTKMEDKPILMLSQMIQNTHMFVSRVKK